jgi:hypothetical protein
MMHPEERREAWIRRRAEWWANKRVGKSSEDVWDIREYVSFPPPCFQIERPQTENRCAIIQNLSHQNSCKRGHLNLLLDFDTID